MVDKTVVSHGSPCPGVDPLITPLGSQADYCLAITNNSGQAVHNINAVDDNGTANYTFLNQLLIAAGLSDANGDGQPDTLAAGQSVSIQYGPITFADPDGQLFTSDIVRVGFTFSVSSGAECLAYYTDPSTVINGPSCVQQPAQCNDTNACTADACDPVGGCVHTPVACGTGATRTIGYYATHPAMITLCLAAKGGTIDLGFVELRDEIADDEIDVDFDSRVETGLMLTLGILKGNIAKLRNGVHRTPLAHARMQAGQQMIGAICNQALTGAVPSFDLDAAVATLAGNDIAAILAVNNQADAFNNSKDSVPLGFSGGAASPKAQWDDPLDPTD